MTEGSHIFVIKEKKNVPSALIAYADQKGFELVALTAEQEKMLREWNIPVLLQKDSSTFISWMMYQVHTVEDFIGVVPCHGSGIDQEFHDEILSLSVDLKKVFYLWKEHSYNGLAIYKDGAREKCLNVHTHGPAMEVDDQEVEYVPALLDQAIEQEGLMNIWLYGGHATNYQILFFLEKGYLKDVNQLLTNARAWQRKQMMKNNVGCAVFFAFGCLVLFLLARGC